MPTVRDLAARLDLSESGVYYRMSRLDIRADDNGLLTEEQARQIETRYDPAKDFRMRPHTLSSIERETGLSVGAIGYYREQLKLGKWLAQGQHGAEWRLSDYERQLLLEGMPQEGRRPNPARWLKVGEAANRLGITVRVLRRMLNEDVPTLRGEKYKGEWEVDPRSIDRLLYEQKRLSRVERLRAGLLHAEIAANAPRLLELIRRELAAGRTPAQIRDNANAILEGRDLLRAAIELAALFEQEQEQE